MSTEPSLRPLRELPLTQTNRPSAVCRRAVPQLACGKRSAYYFTAPAGMYYFTAPAVSPATTWRWKTM